MTYNLIDEEWIPVFYRNGIYRRTGIRRALSESHLIRDIAASNPMDRLAILRFLLALVYWCKGNPSENPGAEGLAGNWDKLEKERDCFELLGTRRRFYQCMSAQRLRPITDLLQEIPTGNNFWHFRHCQDGKDGLCLPCCTMGLLRLPLFSVTGLPNLKAGINGAPPIYVIPVGRTLAETLQINWMRCVETGMPAWLEPTQRPAPGTEVPMLNGLTALSRRVFLQEPHGKGICANCGTNGLPLIITCGYESAGELRTEHWIDPHVLYSSGTPRKSLQAADLTSAGKFRMDKPQYDLLAQMLKNIPRDGHTQTRFWIVGFATHQAKNIDVWESSVELPACIAMPDAPKLVELWQKQSASMVPQLGKGRSGKSKARRNKDIPAHMANIRPYIEHTVSNRIGQILGKGIEAWREVAGEYRPMMRVLAESLSPGISSRALHRRRTMQTIVPQMHLPGEERKGQSKKRGEA